MPSSINGVCFSSHALREDSQCGEEFIRGQLGFLIVHELAEDNSSLSNEDLKDYAKFKNILLNFQRLYGIEKYNLKDLDRYLWQLGKKYFPNNYGK